MCGLRDRIVLPQPCSNGEEMAKHRQSVGEDSRFGSENCKIFLKITMQTKRKLSLEARVRKMQTLSLRGSMIVAMQSSFKTKSLCSLFYLTNQKLTLRFVSVFLISVK